MKKNIALVIILTSQICYSMDTMLINAGDCPGAAVVLQTMLKIIDEDGSSAAPEETIASLRSSLPRLCRSAELPHERTISTPPVLRRSMSYLEALMKKDNETETS